MSNSIVSVSGTPAVFSNAIPQDVLNATIGSTIPREVLSARETAIAPAGISANLLQSLNKPEQQLS